MTLSELSVLVTLTTDSGKILAKLHAVQPQGSLNIVQGIKIAHVSKSHILQPVLTADTHPGLGITLWGLVTFLFNSCVSQLSVDQISRNFVYF